MVSLVTVKLFLFVVVPMNEIISQYIFSVPSLV